MTKTSVINRLSITMAGLITDYLLALISYLIARYSYLDLCLTVELS